MPREVAAGVVVGEAEQAAEPARAAAVLRVGARPAELHWGDGEGTCASR
jgi:hypothetical protein